MAASRYLLNKYGMLLHLEKEPKTVNVTTTVTKILEHNGDRVHFLVVNLGDYDVFVAPSSRVSTSYGIKLSAHGGSCTFDIDDDGLVVTMDFYAVSESGTSTLFIYEIVGEKHG